MTLATFLKWVNLPFREIVPREIVPLGIQPSKRWIWVTNANGHKRNQSKDPVQCRNATLIPSYAV